jgi:hypothetical protein
MSMASKPSKPEYVDPIGLLRERVEQSSQSQVARDAMVSQSYLSDLLKRRRDPGQKILDFLGLERQSVYIHKRS